MGPFNDHLEFERCVVTWSNIKGVPVKRFFFFFLGAEKVKTNAMVAES